MKYFIKFALMGILNTHLCFSTEHCCQAPHFQALQIASTAQLSKAPKTSEHNTIHDEQINLSMIEYDANPDDMEKLKAAEQEKLAELYQRINEYIEAAQKTNRS